MGGTKIARTEPKPLCGGAAIVTGAGSGIGRAIAVALAKTGSYILINYRSREEDAQQTLTEVERNGGSGELCPFDVADASASERAVAKILQPAL